MFFVLPVVAIVFDTGWPEELVPSIYLTAAWVIPILIFLRVTNVFARLVCLTWMIWFAVGSVNIVASYLFYGDSYLLDVDYADFVYIVFATVFFASILAYARAYRAGPFQTTCEVNDRRTTILDDDIPPLLVLLFVCFPFLWGISVYVTLGHVPLLRAANIDAAVNIEEVMYEQDFGPLYGLAVINVLSMSVLLDKVVGARRRGPRLLYLLLLTLVAFISVMTGKRMMLMLFLVVGLCYLVKVKGPRILRRASVLVGVVVAGLFYAGLMILRQGLNVEGYDAVELQLSVIGVEFRDFVYAVNHFTASDLKDHDWIASTVASGVNSTLLDFLGINKQEILGLALGSVSKPLFFGGDFGVRTGLVSELFLAFSFWGLIVISLFGNLVAFVCRRLAETKSKGTFLFLSTVYGLFLMAPVQQSIDVVGTLAVLLYSWILFVFLRRLARRVSAPAIHSGIVRQCRSNRD
jgi:oligosaccharide repeat unit polymerase